jgi:predicted DCC family thiol-disulfide oxidoreductase YuxK
MLRLTGRDASNPIVFYDGARGLCSQWVQFVIRRDRRGEFRFAALQSEFAARVLRRHGACSHALDSMAVVLGILPTCLRSRLYRIIAARRYRWFGAASSCVRLDPAHRQRFLDV